MGIWQTVRRLEADGNARNFYKAFTSHYGTTPRE